MNKLELMKTANEIRKGIVTAVHSAKSGHPGGSLSAADIYTYLYFEELNIDPEDPKKADRDRFVLSKGHTAPGLYSTLAHRGFFPVEDLTTLRHTGSYLQGHPDMKHIPGVDMSSGSLGQGISAAVGMAISAKLSNEDYRVYTLLGDGEIQEGQVWEAAMLAGFRKLDNLVVIVDNNNLQIDGAIDEVNSPYPIDKKFEAFNFHVITIDGNDFDQIEAAFKEARETKGMPTAIVAKTVSYTHLDVYKRQGYGSPYPQGNAGAAGGFGGGMEEPAKKPEIPLAIPEDVQEVVKNFRAIADEISDPVRTTLKKARLSLGGENRLMVVLPEGIEASIAGREDHVKELEALIEQRIGKKVEVEVRQVEEGRRFDDTFVDIEKKINMEITVED